MTNDGGPHLVHYGVRFDAIGAIGAPARALKTLDTRVDPGQKSHSGAQQFNPIHLHEITRFCFLTGRLNRFTGELFQTQKASRPP